jgi:PTH1 family peptidyl-tRNA hydrolase
MKVIVGLGNPGPKYDLTRHNAGFLALEWKLDAAQWKPNKKFNALMWESAGCLFAKPQTFMNESGRSVRALLDYYGLLPDDLSALTDLSDVLTVVHDDLDVDLGKVKMTTDSRSAGHRGVESIIQNLGTQKFTRYRLGVRTPISALEPAEKFVLHKFPAAELKILKATIALLPEF